MKAIVGLASAIVFASGCASILSDSNYPVNIQSTPEGASYEVVNTKTGSTISKGTTPSTVTLNASQGFFQGAEYQISFSKEGYGEQEFSIRSSMDGWYLGNIIFGGLIGILVIDPATGAMWKLNDAVDVSLNADQTAGKDLSIMTFDQLSDAQKSNLTLVRSGD